ncbi:MAG: hypothetical protein QW818_03865 [Candidatus Aenigmatarchaeota archaeon]|nr:hypothetical protein [Candidatus Aenigmarchaeota archaeon]
MNFLLDLFSKKILHIDGTDFLFFAPWLAGTKFGIIEGLTLAAIILVIHSLMHLKIARFILVSFPAQILAVFFGYLFGLEGFWITLVAYYFISTIITWLLGGLGSGYFVFLLTNSITNIVAFFVYQVLT